MSDGKLVGGITGKGFLPGQTGNAGGKPRQDGKIRVLLRETLELSREGAIKALCARWKSPRYVQDMAEFLGKLEGELAKDVGDGTGRGIQIIVLSGDGAHPLDPAAFRAAVAERANGHEEPEP